MGNRLKPYKKLYGHCQRDPLGKWKGREVAIELNCVTKFNLVKVI